MHTEYYPENLLKDYNLLLEYFPSHTICRPFVVSEIKKWKNTYGKDEIIHILEVGPGYGETTELILKEIRASMTLIEIDKIASNIILTNLEKHKEHISIINEDATTWIKAQPDSSFDVFTASWVLHNFPKNEREEFLSEIKRVLKTGGLFIIFDKIFLNDEAENEKLMNLRLDRLAELTTVGRPDLNKDMVAHEERDCKPPFVWYEKDLFETMENIGFKELSIANRNEHDVVFSAVKI